MDMTLKQTDDVTVGHYRGTACARCGGCGSRPRSLSVCEYNVPSASCLPLSGSVDHNTYTHLKTRRLMPRLLHI